jgi:Tol biopolymer transport system component
MDWPLRLEFSPGGHRGIYADTVPWDLLQVNFTTGESRVIGWGYAPRWSRNGQRIAYTGETYEMEPEFRYYNPLYVVNADGTGTRRVTASRTPDHAYMAAAWSKDNVHVVATRRTWADVSLTIPRDALRIVNVDSRVVLSLPSGSAEAGAWFEP